MATVGSLFINVKARTAAFSKKMKGVRASIRRMAVGFGRVAKRAAMFGAVLIGVAVVALTAMIKKGLAAVDTLAKLAKNIGTTVKSIQIMRHMATLGGVSIEKMDKAISKMTRGIGESAVFGIGEANDAFKELGLSASELETLSTEDAFGRIADSINNMGNEARQGILAYKIFGRAGQELLTTLSGGSQAIDAMSEKLERFGVLIGDDQASLVEKANDAWADIGLMWSGISNQLAVQFAPMLELVARTIRQLVVSMGGIQPVSEIVLLSIAKMGAAAWNTMRKIQSGWMTFKASIVAGGGQILEWWSELFGDDTARLMAESMFKQAGEMILDAEAFVPITDIEERLKKLRDELMNTGLQDSRLDLKIVDLPDIAKDFKGAAENLSTAIGSMNVEGDAQSRILNAQLSLEQQQLETSKLTLAAIRNGGALT